MNRKTISVISYAMTIAACIAMSACSEGDKYGKEVERETVMEVTQEPYKFSLFAKCRDEGYSTLQINILKDSAFVGGAQATADLSTPDGSKQTAMFQEERARKIYEASVPLKHHADYMVNSEIMIEGKKFTPIFSFHSGDPVLEKMNNQQNSK